LKNSKVLISLAVIFIVLLFAIALKLNMMNNVADDESDSASSSTSEETEIVYPDGVYTDGLASMIFSGTTVDISGMVFEYTIEDGYIVLDADSLYYSDELLEVYEYEGKTDDEVAEQMETTKSAASELLVSYNATNDWIMYESDIYVKTESYDLGPSGTYVCGSDENVTITFDNGMATFDNGEVVEETPYVIYDDVNGMEVVFYATDFETTYLYSGMGINYIYYDDVDTLKISSDTFTLAS